MPVTITPYIPRYITVHLAPGQNAENVTVTFPDYIKNVASSEIYPTWEPSALRANILAQVSFALNRVYTEYYPSRGYPFQITSTTATDQKFIRGRNILRTLNASWMSFSTITSAVRALRNLCRPNSATGPPPPVTASPNGAARSSPSGAGQRIHSAALLRKRYRACHGCPVTGCPNLLSRLSPAPGAAGA